MLWRSLSEDLPHTVQQGGLAIHQTDLGGAYSHAWALLGKRHSASYVRAAEQSWAQVPFQPGYVLTHPETITSTELGHTYRLGRWAFGQGDIDSAYPRSSYARVHKPTISQGSDSSFQAQAFGRTFTLDPWIPSSSEPASALQSHPFQACPPRKNTTLPATARLSGYFFFPDHRARQDHDIPHNVSDVSGRGRASLYFNFPAPCA